ncbi:MAG: aspartate kinase [Desulfurococcales archaeon ex4484_58]|nr:MAG: aspartate kinase [Desulfurococcales archaeon ex4484_58]
MSETIGTVFVKIGGSFLTYKDKPFSINLEALTKTYRILRRIGDEIKLILGNGGGSFAHPIVIKYRDRESNKLIVECHRATRLLNNMLVNYLVNKGLKVTSIQTSAIIVRDKRDYIVFAEPIIHALDNNIIPVVYGECIFSIEKGYEIVSTEKVFELLAKHIKPHHIVLLTDVKGIYSCDPRTCSEAELIKLINRNNLDEILDKLKKTEKEDVTGSIYGKVSSMAQLSKELGIKIYIVSGFNEEEVIKAVLDRGIEEGTIIDLG